VPRPEPQAGEVLIRVYATGVLPAEWKMREGAFRAFRPAQFPYIPGSAVAGVVEEVGPNVKAFQPGQAVFGRSTGGTYAEYTTTAVEAPALTSSTFSLLALKPTALSFDEAATISGGATTAWMALFEDGGMQAGQRVLNVDFVRSLGAETVIDYTTTPFEDVVQDIDLVLDTIGGEAQRRSLNLIKRGGTLVSLLGQPPHELAHERGIRAMSNAALPNSELLLTIANLIETGHVKPVIMRTFALQEAPQAHTLSQTGHGRGRIVLRIGD
jgi:NADPH:quinone reductase-like Zn-dependent oxidoreductase